MSTESIDSVGFYVNKAVNDILKASSRKQTKLKDACKATIEALKGCTVEAMMGKADEGPSKVTTTIIETMRLACETKTPKMVAPALDSLHKLMAFGFVHGLMTMPEDPSGGTVRAIDRVVAIIVSCYDVQDANVQLQILKACLTAATTPACDLHDQALMSAVRTCYNIFLVSHTPVNVTTAKGILRQIVHGVFNKFEIEAALKRAAQAQAQQQAQQQQQQQAAQTSQGGASAPSASATTPSSSPPPQTSSSAGSVEPDIESETPPQSPAEAAARDILLEIVAKVPGIAKPRPPAAAPKEQKPSESPAPAATVPKAPSTTAAATPAVATPKSLHQRSQSAFIDDGAAKEIIGISPAESRESSEIAFADCFLLFRALCKLSMKEALLKEQDEEAGQQLQSKVLSLELLYGVVENAGPALRGDTRFVDVAIKKHLCDSLVQNGVSPIPRVFKYSLSIFLSIMKHFKGPLKTEIGVFFSSIFLRVLESQNSTLQQKWMVLQLLHHVCKDPQALVDLYLNYDCDLQSTDVFVRMVNDLSKVAQGTVTPLDGWTSPSQDMALKTLGLECLVMIMKSLVDWTKEGSATVQQQPAEKPEKEEAEEEKEKEEHPEATTPPPSTEEKEVAVDDLDQFRKQKQRKSLLEEARTKWSLSPRRAIEYLKKMGLINDTPDSLGKFLREVEGLDKKLLGEYIGGSKPFNKQVLKAYVEEFRFTGMELDEALRYFLGMFLLPGEGQVVDRVMENFGSRYFRDNPSGRFADADAVYKLSFAIIMLATDIHNPRVKNKLKFEQWVKMVNKDLQMGLEEAYLKAIYDRISAKKLELLDAGAGTPTIISDLLNPKQRQVAFTEETSKWVDYSMKQMREKRAHTTEFFHAKKIEYVQPIFESMWASAVVSFSILLESSDEPRVIDLCLAGFKYGIHVASVFFMETERSTFVTALEKFTLLNNLREMRPKNIGAIKSLIGIAYSEGNYLQDSWTQVLRCVSLLERLHLTGSGLKPDVIIAEQQAQQQREAGQSRGKAEEAKAKAKAKVMTPEAIKGSAVVPQSPFTARVSPIEASNSRAVSLDIDSAFIDRLFTDSTVLNDAAIIEFVRALCQVSLSEISSPTPRIFSLQKIVEVAYYNMNRMRLVWTEIWGILKQHFIQCGCHEMSTVSIYAIDSLRQLSVKYLEKDELANYNFQKEFLKPFEVVIGSTQSESVKDFVLQSLRQIVLTRTANICSGWKTIFVVLTTAAEEEGKTLPLAFELLAEIMRNYYDVVSNKFFVELVSSLVAFGKNTVHSEISLRAIAFLMQCANNLVSGHPQVAAAVPVEVPSASAAGTSGASAPSAAVPAEQTHQFTDALSHLSVWFPILTGLSSIASHPHIDVRSSSLSMLFGILSNNGNLFSPRLWELIFRGTLIPLFDSVGYSRGDTTCADPDIEWLNTTCLNALQSLISLFTAYFNTISFLLPEILELLGAFITQENDMLAGIGTTCFYQLVMDNGGSFTRQMWSSVDSLVETFFARDVDMIRRISKAAQPPEAVPPASEPAKESAPAPPPVTTPSKTPTAAATAVETKTPVVPPTHPVPLKPASPNPELKSQHAAAAAAAAAPPIPVAPARTATGSPVPTQAARKSQDITQEAPAETADIAGEIKLRRCAMCGTSENEKGLLRCPLCDTVFYCSMTCQKDDWPRHQRVCLKQYSQGSAVRIVLPKPKRFVDSSTHRFITLTQSPHTDSASPGPKALGLEAVGLTAKIAHTRCEVARGMLKVIEEVLFKQYSHMSTEDLLRVVDALAGSVASTTGLVASDGARSALQEARLLEAIARKERESLAFYLRVTFHLYNEAEIDAQNREANAEQRLIQLCHDVLEQHSAQHDSESRLPNVLLVLDRLLKIRENQYRRHIGTFYSVLADLIADDHTSVRELVRSHFIRIGKLTAVDRKQPQK